MHERRILGEWKRFEQKFGFERSTEIWLAIQPVAVARHPRTANDGGFQATPPSGGNQARNVSRSRLNAGSTQPRRLIMELISLKTPETGPL